MTSPRVPDADPASRVVVTMLWTLLGLTAVSYAAAILFLSLYVGGPTGLAAGITIVLASFTLALVAIWRSRRRWQRRSLSA